MEQCRQPTVSLYIIFLSCLCLVSCYYLL